MRIQPGHHVQNINHPYHRGEHRWLSNWLHVLRSVDGYDIVDSDSDLILGVQWENNSRFKDVPHVHLRFGALGHDLLPHLKCFGDNCKVAAPYLQDIQGCAPDLISNAIFMPIPYMEEWLPQPRIAPLERREITWAAKETWHPGFLERGEPHVAQCGIWVLEAIRDLARERDLTLNVIQCNEAGSNFDSAPQAARDVLAEIPNVNMLTGSQSLSTLLELFSRSRLSLPVAGALGSTLEAVFAGCIPLAHVGMVLGEQADVQGLHMPTARNCTKEDIQNGLRKLFDDNHYQQVWECYQEGIKPHLAPNAVRFFESGL